MEVNEDATQWNWKNGVILFLIMLGLNFFLLSSIQLGTLTLTGWEFDPNTGVLINAGSIVGVWLGTVIGEFIILLVTLLFAFYVFRGHIGDFKIKMPSLWHLVIAIVGAFGAYLAALFGGILQLLLTGPDPHQDTYNALFQTNTPLELVVWILLMVLVVAPCEEFFARGFVQTSIQNSCKTRNKPIIIAILVASFFFALLHLDFYRIIPLFFVGLILGIVYYYTDNLLTPIITHGLYNAIGVLLFFLLP